MEWIRASSALPKSFTAFWILDQQTNPACDILQDICLNRIDQVIRPVDSLKGQADMFAVWRPLHGRFMTN